MVYLYCTVIPQRMVTFVWTKKDHAASEAGGENHLLQTTRIVIFPNRCDFRFAPSDLDNGEGREPSSKPLI